MRLDRFQCAALYRTRRKNVTHFSFKRKNASYIPQFASIDWKNIFWSGRIKMFEAYRFLNYDI